MRLAVLDGAYTVCKIRDTRQVDWSGELTFLGCTPEEISLVCQTNRVPEDAQMREDGWRALRVEGVLEFSLVGVLAGITAALAAAKVSVFCVSTFDTDYVLVKETVLETAIFALKNAGYAVD
ncbi:MAG: ACT domain-containing protein [Candidatus Spyradocola sp.]